MIDNKVVGMAIAKLRQAENMTQQTLAACLNVSHQAVSKWEKGVTLPDVLTLVELSRMFGVTLEQLLSGDVDFRLEGKEEPAARPIELKLDYTDINAKAEKAIEDAEFAAEESSEEEVVAEGETVEEPQDEHIDLDRIIEMAPFMSRAALDEIVTKYNGKCSPRQLSKLAPFLSKDTLEKLVVNCESDIGWDTLRRLAPFLRKEFVDAFTTAAAKGEKYTGDFGKQLKHGLKKVYKFTDQIYHDSIKPALKKVIEPEKPAKKAAEPAVQPEKPVNKVSAARVRIFERALTEDKFDWIGEHIDQLEDEALKAKIRARATELGMTEWLSEYMGDYCDQESIDDAILSGNWDYVAANIEFAGEDALVLIADTAAAEGKWDWLTQNIKYIAGCADAREAVIDHALKASNLDWLGENLEMLELSEDDVALITSKAMQNGDWGWLEAHFDELDCDWADMTYAENAYKAGYKALAVSIIENHLDGEDLTGLMLTAINAGDVDFIDEIMDYNSGDLSNVCITLASSGNLEKAIEIAEEHDVDVIAELIDVATDAGNWDMIDRLNDLL